MKLLDKILGIKREIQESYYERGVRLKPIIESNTEILENAKKSFENMYLNTKHPLIYLGSGDHHQVQNIGQIFDPINKRNIHLATRLIWEDSYMFDKIKYLLTNLKKFEGTHLYYPNLKSPYFCLVMAWENPKTLKKINGMILEDVSENKKLKLKEKSKMGGTFEREDRKIFVLDPMIYDKTYEKTYLAKEARIFL